MATVAREPVQADREGRLERYVMRRFRPQRTAVRLDRRRIYILPTVYGYLFAAMLVVMFLWAINYNNNMCFAMTFLLAGVAVNAMWRTHVNLLDVRVHPGRIEPVFAGQQARFVYAVDCADGGRRYGIGLRRRGAEPCYRDLSGTAASFVLAVPAERRGWLPGGRVEVFTRFPLGLFHGWSWVEFEQGCLVYPQPRGSQPLPPARSTPAGTGSGEAAGGAEDYSGLREYVRGDSPRHVAWKATAREGGLLVKRFTGQARPELWLDWRLVEVADVEGRLSQLCQWLLKAELEGRRYGLRLPGLELPQDSGAAHRRRCLEALALFQGGAGSYSVPSPLAGEGQGGGKSQPRRRGPE